MTTPVEMPRALQGKTLLVVGGAGFVGANLVAKLLAFNPKQLWVVDNLLSSERFNLPLDDRIHFVEASITEDAVLASLPEDLAFVFHLATYHGNQSSIHNPLADHENNTLTTLKLLERLKRLPALEALVYAGAGCCVAEKTFDAACATEETEMVSLKGMDSPYALSKVFGEFYCNYYHRQHNVPAIRARFQNVYGPGEVLGAGRWRGTPATVWRNVVPTFIYKALTGQALPVENGGIATRDFIFVEDIVDGLIACALKGEPGEVYNLASGQETTILALAETINRLTQNVTPLAFEPARHWDRSGKRYGSTQKAKDVLGFCAQVGLEAGLARTIAWTQAHLGQIEQTMLKHTPFLGDSPIVSPARADLANPGLADGVLRSDVAILR
ncbi:MAG: NAD-dependent epimerase/dehydratase family protein [Candidatus Melainabacteria bacterium]|nr:NAD-dependent epimerase/dehydratase family protein [Candidatus Melainabacteria bacterium]